MLQSEPFKKFICYNVYVALLAAGKLDLLFQRGNIEKLLSKEILRYFGCVRCSYVHGKDA